MFYDNNTVEYLIDRIGWAEPIQPTSITIESRNTASLSGRFFREFNKMAIVENVKETMPNAQASKDEFNDFLYELKKEAVMSVLSLVFDVNERANYRLDIYNRRIDISGNDYSNVIQTTRQRLFDDAIGYSLACKAIELFITSNRKNADERGNKYNHGVMIGELNGIKNEYGKELSVGLYALKAKQIAKIIDILFPQQTTPAVIGRHPW